MRISILLMLLVLAGGCRSAKISTGMIDAAEPVIIYQTKGDYYLNVPVTMNDAKDKIVSYPGPSDLLFEGDPVYPVRLRGTFLLDRRGIGPNTVFTSYTYKEYIALEEPPSIQELLDHVLDRNPFESMYECGKRGHYADLVKQLNEKIEEDCKDCEKIK